MQQLIKIIKESYNNIINIDQNIQEIETINNILLFKDINIAIQNNVINKDNFNNLSILI